MPFYPSYPPDSQEGLKVNLKAGRTRCLFCYSSKCPERVYTKEGDYDEVACWKHLKALHKHSDETIPGRMRTFSTSTAAQERETISAWRQRLKATN